MTTPPAAALADRAHGLGPTRARVLGTLQDLRVPSTAGEVARRLGIHLNTARFHLDALVSSGLAERAREDRRRPGRPQVHYAATQSAPQATHRSYRLLAEILSRHLARHSSDPGHDGVEAGRDYGRFVAAASGPVGSLPSGEAVAAVVATLDGMGFDSRRVPDEETASQGALVEVTNCPFLEVAEGHLEIVCAVHRGIMEGMLEELGGSARVERLDPLVAPSRCVARFTTHARRRGVAAGEPPPR
ncbi:MAG: helix-turn-helix transcriptional regulator [Intrasporangium sp.]|uniref:helix-turn-helix transcriptional regulator n=1 Tax=Intrasporangium sp. TaxID=1925024 RepID=UPI003F7E02C5